MWDHLHLRGENRNTRSTIDVEVGSPPLTWRKQKVVMIDHSLSRITSTYVEKTQGGYEFKHGDGDHLHLRGENKTWCELLPTP